LVGFVLRATNGVYDEYY